MTKTKDHLPLINRDLKPASTSRHDYELDAWEPTEKKTEWHNMTPQQQNEIIKKNNDNFNENVRQTLEKLDRATESSYLSSSSKIMNLVLL